MGNRTHQAVILGAGLGTRLRPLTDNLPKVMLPIGGKPLILHHIEQLKKFGVDDFFINLHYLPDKITDFFGDGSGFGVKITYNYEKEILGTAGALPAFTPYVKDRFYLVYGDIFTLLDYGKFADFDYEKGGVGSVMVKKTDHPYDSDLVILDDKDRIKFLYQKPHKEVFPSDSFGMGGIYILSKRVLDIIPTNKYCELDHQIIPEVIKRDMPFYGYLSSEPVQDVGTFERYRKIIEKYGE